MHIAYMNRGTLSAPPGERATRGERLAWAREHLGHFNSAAEAARAMGVSESTYSLHENGSGGRGLPVEPAIKYAAFFKISLEWLLTGRGRPRGKNFAQVVGYIGAGSEVIPVDDHAQGASLEEVEPPPGVDFPCVAARIRGNSMHPFQDGWLVFWTKDQDGVPEECIGKLCVVKLQDGRMYLKTLRTGSTKHHYHLESWNAPTIENAALEWAAKVTDVRPT